MKVDKSYKESEKDKKLELELEDIIKLNEADYQRKTKYEIPFITHDSFPFDKPYLFDNFFQKLLEKHLWELDSKLGKGAYNRIKEIRDINNNEIEWAKNRIKSEYDKIHWEEKRESFLNTQSRSFPSIKSFGVQLIKPEKPKIICSLEEYIDNRMKFGYDFQPETIQELLEPLTIKEKSRIAEKIKKINEVLENEFNKCNNKGDNPFFCLDSDKIEFFNLLRNYFLDRELKFPNQPFANGKKTLTKLKSFLKTVYTELISLKANGNELNIKEDNQYAELVKCLNAFHDFDLEKIKIDLYKINSL